MNDALFIKDGISKKITADEIESRTHYLSTYSGCLFCNTPGCPAELSFALTPDFRIKKMFKTKKNSEHAEHCPHKIVHSGSAKYRYSSETVNQTLSSKHRRDVLQKLYARNLEQTPPTGGGSSSGTSTRLKKDDSNTELLARPVASIDTNAESAKQGQKEPPVRKRKSNDILPEDVGLLRGIDGYALSAHIDENSVEIELEPNFSILFYNAFRDSSPEAYRQVQRIADDINCHSMPFLVCCIGVVERKEAGYQIQIMDSSLITFNNKAAISFYL